MVAKNLHTSTAPHKLGEDILSRPNECNKNKALSSKEQPQRRNRSLVYYPFFSYHSRWCVLVFLKQAITIRGNAASFFWMLHLVSYDAFLRVFLVSCHNNFFIEIFFAVFRKKTWATSFSDLPVSTPECSLLKCDYMFAQQFLALNDQKTLKQITPRWCTLLRFEFGVVFVCFGFLLTQTECVRVLSAKHLLRKVKRMLPSFLWGSLII